MHRFWSGLNLDIRDIIMHEDLYFIEQLFHLACKAEQNIRRRGHMPNKCAMELSSPMPKKDNFAAVPPYDYGTYII
jgi:hypothetical protein